MGSIYQSLHSSQSEISKMDSSKTWVVFDSEEVNTQTGRYSVSSLDNLDSLSSGSLDLDQLDLSLQKPGTRYSVFDSLRQRREMESISGGAGTSWGRGRAGVKGSGGVSRALDTRNSTRQARLVIQTRVIASYFIYNRDPL